MKDFSIKEDEMERLRKRLDTAADEFSAVTLPANPGVASLGVENLFNAFDAFAAAAEERLGAAETWCRVTGQAVDAASSNSFLTDFVLTTELNLTFNEDRY